MDWKAKFDQPTNLSSRFATLLRQTAQREAEYKHSRRSITNEEYYSDAKSNKRTSYGDLIYNKVKKYLSLFPRTPDQKLFHKDFLNAYIPLIYQKEWKHSSLRILQRLGISCSIKQEKLVITPRRWGKTFAIAQFVASVACAVPGIVICIFSNGSRASINLLNCIYDRINDLKQNQRIIKLNTTDIYMSSEIKPAKFSFKSQYCLDRCKHPETTRIRALPGVVDGLRGTHMHAAIMEEASFSDDAAFYKLIVPYMGMGVFPLLAISSPEGEDNWYSNLASMKTETGEFLFDVLTVDLVCKRCKERGVNKEKCVHNLHRLPPWKSAEKQKKILQMMSNGANAAVYMRENMGSIESSAIQYCFTKKHIDGFYHRREYHWQSFPQVIFTVVDPSGGGPSKYAIISIAVDDKGNIVVSLLLFFLHLMLCVRACLLYYMVK